MTIQQEQDTTLVIILNPSFTDRLNPKINKHTGSKTVVDLIGVYTNFYQVPFKKIIVVTDDSSFDFYRGLEKMSQWRRHNQLVENATRVQLSPELFSSPTALNFFILFTLPHMIHTKYYITINQAQAPDHFAYIDYSNFKRECLTYDYSSIKETFGLPSNFSKTNIQSDPFFSIKTRTLGIFVANFAANLLASGVPSYHFCPENNFIANTILSDLLERGFKFNPLPFTFKNGIIYIV